MKFISINNLGEYPEDFLFAKIDVERYLIEEKIIEKRMRLDEFLFYLNIQDNIYMFNDCNISFSVQKGEKDSYVFYSMLDEDNTEVFEKFQHRLEIIKYSVKNMNKISNYDLLDIDFSTTEIIMSNKEFYK